MNPKIDSTEPVSARNGTNIPHHGQIPKWLEEISERTLLSGKYGPTSPLTTQLYFKNTPKNIGLTSNDYLVPKFEGIFDFHDLLPLDMHQQELEKSWRSLNEFEQNHKGRLDSAKNQCQSGNVGNFRTDNTKFKTNNTLEDKVPIRCRSEMSDYSPFNKTKFGPKHEDASILQTTQKLNKSLSSENVFGRPTSDIRDSFDLLRPNKFDPHFERKMFEYKMNIAKENQMRDEIINELLAENERITERTRRKSLDSQSAYFASEFSAHKKMFKRNPKYKSRYTKVTNLDDDEDFFEEIMEDFIIPELPSGRMMHINILSTWGDRYYVGLNGVEIFDRDGNLAEIQSISAIPSDVNILPECHDDPRVVRNLLDGVNRTQDDMHIWLAPFYPKRKHVITIIFSKVITIAMMRIWNYNKSRIHSYRGVKDMTIYLDNRPIFKGEIAKACGGILGGIDAFGDTILFTTDAGILENISKNDTSFATLKFEHREQPSIERPPTAALNTEMRPYTKPNTRIHATREDLNSSSQSLLGAKEIDIVLQSNWGHAYLIGLTGLEIIQANDEVVNLGVGDVSCEYGDQHRYLHRLLNGINVTTQADNMWSTRYKLGDEVVLHVSLPEFKYLSGLRIWNYNENLMCSYAGVRTIKIVLDDKILRNTRTNEDFFILRRAPGNEHYDFVQEICFAQEPKVSTSDVSLLDGDLLKTLPQGFVFQFIIFSTWGDQYYCGLNGMEFYNEFGKKIVLEDQDICAYPESINALPQVTGDVRTPEKIIDGINNDRSGLHSWLAPIVDKHLNRIYVVLDNPITLSYIKVWNYSKTPKRGVKEFGILVDDLLVYNGTLKMFKLDESKDFYQTVLFTEDNRILGTDTEKLISSSNDSQDVVLLDESLRATTGGSLPNADPALRPFTSVSTITRAGTSFSQ